MKSSFYPANLNLSHLSLITTSSVITTATPRGWRSSQHKTSQHLHHTEAIPLQNSTSTSEISYYFTFVLVLWDYRQLLWEIWFAQWEVPAYHWWACWITDSYLIEPLSSEYSSVNNAIGWGGQHWSFRSLPSIRATSRKTRLSGKGSLPCSMKDGMVRHKRIFH